MNIKKALHVAHFRLDTSSKSLYNTALSELVGFPTGVTKI